MSPTVAMTLSGPFAYDWMDSRWDYGFRLALTLPERRKRLDDRLNRRGWLGAILENCEPFIEISRRVVKASGQSGALESCCDLSHFTHVAPGFGRRHRGGADAPASKIRLRNGPFFEQRFVDPFMRCQRADRQKQSIRAFGPGRISDFERGSRARIFSDGPGVEHAGRK